MFTNLTTIKRLLATASLSALGFAGAPAAQAQTLHNLSPLGATIADGNKACPGTAYYLYAGGYKDGYAAPADAAYPSPNLTAFIPGGGPTVAYDVPMVNGRFGDSFNLQNTRSVCYAIIQYKTKSTNGGSSNDGLTFGHVGPGGTPFSVVGQVINPGGTNATQSYALDSTGIALLGTQTGGNLAMPKTPEDSIFDLYLQDDTEIDFFKLYVWYGPPSDQGGPNPN